MSSLPIKAVRGEHLVDRKKQEALPAGLDLSRLKTGPVNSIQISIIDGKAVARIEAKNGKIQLVDLATGQARAPVSAAEAERVARVAWLGKPGVKTTVSAVTEESTEYRGDLPAWRIRFDDADATNVFVPESTGRIAAVRTETWRFYDFMWGLHIMDWTEHENFNTPWLVCFAFGGLLLALAGLVLLIIRWPLKRRNKGIR